MTESGHLANAPLTKLLTETVGAFKVTLERPDTVTMVANGIRNAVSADRVTLAPRNTRGIDGTEKINDMPDTKYRANEDGTVKNGALISGEFSVQSIVRLGTGGRRKYVVQCYGYGPDKYTVDSASHIPQHLWLAIGAD